MGFFTRSRNEHENYGKTAFGRLKAVEMWGLLEF